MTRPVLLIDVDGVLNPEGSRRTIGRREDVRFRKYSLGGFRVFLSRDHGAWLAGLADRYDLAWCTTWEHDANRLVSPLVGLPRDLPVVTFDWSVSARKLPFVDAWLAGRPALWIDDDIDETELGWAARRSADGIPTRILVPDPTTGLTPEHVAEAAAFAASIASGG